VGNVLAVARAIDVDPERVHGEPVEDGGGERGVAEVLAPVAELDVGRHRGRGATVPAIDQVVEGVGGGRLVAVFLDLAKAYVVNDQERRARPALEATSVGAIGEAGVKVVEEIDAAGIAHVESLLARAQGEGLEDVTLAGAVVAGDHEVIMPAHEVEACELEHERPIEAGLKVPVECLEGLALDQPAAVDAPSDPLLELVGGLEAQDVLEERGGAGALVGGPREELVELVARAGQPEEFEVPSEPRDDGVVVAWSAVSLLGSGRVASLGHAGVSWVRDRDAEVRGRRSYSVRSRGAVRA